MVGSGGGRGEKTSRVVESRKESPYRASHSVPRTGRCRVVGSPSLCCAAALLRPFLAICPSSFGLTPDWPTLVAFPFRVAPTHPRHPLSLPLLRAMEQVPWGSSRKEVFPEASPSMEALHRLCDAARSSKHSRPAHNVFHCGANRRSVLDHFAVLRFSLRDVSQRSRLEEGNAIGPFSKASRTPHTNDNEHIQSYLTSPDKHPPQSRREGQSARRNGALCSLRAPLLSGFLRSLASV